VRLRTVLRGAVTTLGVGVVIVLALVVILTALCTELPRSPGVMSDALGPDPGEPVAAYLQRAADSLATDTPAATGPRWALVTTERPWTAAEAAEATAGLPRVSTLYAQTPEPGVAMPVLTQTLAEPAAGEAGRAPVLARALDRIARAAAGTQDTGRAAQAHALTATRVRAGAPAVIALIVRADTATLRDVADEPGVRSVDALPPDAVWGRFAVRPLLPQQRDAADPLPDGAPVPEA